MFIALALAALSFASEPVVVPDHPVVDAAYDKLVAPHRADWLAESMDRKQALQPIFDRELAKRDLPDDVLAVALHESGFENIPERYPCPSGGVWQFIQRTARAYGLTVDDSVDERLDEEKSTAAALDLLEDLHGEFGNWGLAFAAYNVGEPAVRKAIRTHGTDDWIELVDAGALPTYPAEVMAAVRYLDEVRADRR